VESAQPPELPAFWLGGATQAPVGSHAFGVMQSLTELHDALQVPELPQMYGVQSRGTLSAPTEV
jgi:hypothetical protein